jgi:hypothetical protein
VPPVKPAAKREYSTQNSIMQQLHLWQFISTRLKTRQGVILLSVAASAGSSPGRPGFKMAVDETGAMAGSIGGGIMEVKLVELAKEQLKNGTATPLLKRQIHNNRRFYSIKKGGFKNGETPDPVFDQTHADHFTNQSGRDPVVGKSKK